MTLPAAAIIPAAGSGRRMGLPVPKQFQELAGLPLLVHTLRAFQAVPAISEIVLAVPAAHLATAGELVSRYHLDKVSRIVAGGEQRQDSVRAGLEALSPKIELVAVHDGARPLITAELIVSCLQAAEQHGAAMAAIPVKDTLKAVSAAGLVTATVDRRQLWQAQTPQVARVGLLKAAFALAAKTGFLGTDEAALLEHSGQPVAVVPGSERNIKVTRPEDLTVARALLREHDNGATDMRIGSGYDAHRLVAGRPLVLGGVTIPHPTGLLGHSDADVLTHALCDALLGAAGAGDIGRHFPDSDPAFQGICSLTLLARVMNLLAARGLHLVNADVTVVAQQPRLAPHFPAMQAKLAAVCEVEPATINLKRSEERRVGKECRSRWSPYH